MTKHQLKWIRLALAVIHTCTGIFDASYTGWKPFLWYYSDWLFLMIMLVQWCLVFVHFFPFNSKFNRFTLSLFQIVLPMEFGMTLLYWRYFYTIGSIHWNSTETYVHPIFLYIVPALLLLIEWLLNSIMYQYIKVLHMLVIYIIYVPMTYFGKFALGYYPYYVVTWNNWSSFAVLIGLALMQMICFFIISFLNNFLKRKYLEK